jgi:mono/diheme cytochrome c family protein
LLSKESPDVTLSVCKKRVLSFAIILMILCGWTGGLLDALAMEPGKTEPTPPPAGDTAAPATDRPASPVPSSNPLSGKPEAIDAGRKLYFMWCVQCHGPHADGVSRFGNYAADLRKFWRGYKEFITIVTNGRTARMMPPWKEVLDDQKIAQVGAYLETLAIEDSNWR